MNIYVEGRGPIATAAINTLMDAGHKISETMESADLIVWCRGNTMDKCVTHMLEHMKNYRHLQWVVVTSEHGSIPTMDQDYAGYHAVKAAQKMLCKCMVEWGSSCVDVSPAFVWDSSPDKAIHKDIYYREAVESATNKSFPVTCQDVANCILFAAENCDKISGTVLKVSAGWTQGRI